MMRFVHRRVRVEAGIIHDAVDKIIDDGGDAIDSTESLIKRRLGWL
jgi:hypothetical protein